MILKIISVTRAASGVGSHVVPYQALTGQYHRLCLNVYVELGIELLNQPLLLL